MKLCVIRLFAALLLAGGLPFSVLAADIITRKGPVTILTIDAAVPTPNGIDFAHARPFELPDAPGFVADRGKSDRINGVSGITPPFAGSLRPGVSPGAAGNGNGNPKLVPPSSFALSDLVPQAFGTSNHPFSTARADGFSGTTHRIFPFRASGKLFFNNGSGTASCSAALIKNGVIVTAAHCVAGFAQNRFYSGWQFIAGYKNGTAPYGIQSARAVYLLTSWFDGSDSCAVRGVVCENDIALIVLDADVGAATGHYAYAWDRFGFTSGGLTHVTQTGYPGCLDRAERMARNDSEGFVSASNANNTMIGSLMCGGSSGGPWVINFGRPPALSGTASGAGATPNTVIGVTSWGYVNGAIKEQGASPFLSTNIVPLVNTACGDFPGSC